MALLDLPAEVQQQLLDGEERWSIRQGSAQGGTVLLLTASVAVAVSYGISRRTHIVFSPQWGQGSRLLPLHKYIWARRRGIRASQGVPLLEHCAPFVQPTSHLGSALFVSSSTICRGYTLRRWTVRRSKAGRNAVFSRPRARENRRSGVVALGPTITKPGSEGDIAMALVLDHDDEGIGTLHHADLAGPDVWAVVEQTGDWVDEGGAVKLQKGPEEKRDAQAAEQCSAGIELLVAVLVLSGKRGSSYGGRT